jgi:hypothetical protein
LNSAARGVASVAKRSEAVVVDKPSSAAAEIAREANAYILALEARFHEVSAHARVPDEDLLHLFCECGCMGIVHSTQADYEQNDGVWLDGHKPPLPSD